MTRVMGTRWHNYELPVIARHDDGVRVPMIGVDYFPCVIDDDGHRRVPQIVYPPIPRPEAMW